MVVFDRKIQGLDKLRGLRELNLSYNFISRLEGLGQLKLLTDLNLAENNIHKVCPCSPRLTIDHNIPQMQLNTQDPAHVSNQV